jgi:predicted aconitase with swiveling domain
VASAVRLRPIVPGNAEGSVLLCARPISLWGGVDPASGRIIDRRHDRHGESIAGRVFALPGEKGSSTGSAVLLELIRIGMAPAAIVTRSPSPALTLGAIVAEELYGKFVPIFRATEAGFGALRHGERIRIAESGQVRRAARPGPIP